MAFRRTPCAPEHAKAEGSKLGRRLLTLEGLADESEGGALVSDGWGVDKGFYGARGAPGGIPAEHAPEHSCCLSPREERGPLRRVPARHPTLGPPVLSGGRGTTATILRLVRWRRHG